ncbi:MAG: ribonuclease HI [Candidatus Pacebacteria bacterium]|nr:ribonuclease HI [Candidatus Paceibacterota bacterium]
MTKTIIFCDGASKGNPGPGGWGAVIVYPEHSRGGGEKVKEIGGGKKHTTNNAMELTAALEGLRATSSFKVLVYTDSSYLINGITKWIYLWEKNGWKTRDKKEVANSLLWEALVIEARKKQIEWKHVSGHSGVWGNERADEIASAFAEGAQPKLFSGNLKNYGADPLKIVVDKVKKEKRDKKRSRKNGPIYSYVSLVNGVLKIHKTWGECEKRVKGKSNARFKRVGSAEEEKEIADEFLNTAR